MLHDLLIAAATNVHSHSVGDIPRGMTRPDLAVYLRPGLHLAIQWRPALTRRFISNLPEHYDSLVTWQAGHTDDKAQGPEGRFMLMVGRFKRKGVRNIYLTRS